MSTARRVLLSVAIAGALASVPLPLTAQAYTLPPGVGAITLALQYYDDTGRRFTDGSRLSVGQTETFTIFFEADYGITNRFAVTLGLPFIFARYKDGPPPPPIPYVPADSCHCWNSSFQDFAFAARYRFFDDPWAVTPHVRYIRPSHDYNYQGEAVVGFDRWEWQLGLGVGVRLLGFLPRATVQAGYTYAFVEQFLGIPNDRSNGSIQLGYDVTRRLNIHATGVWQESHGGLRFGSPSGVPFYPPGEMAILDTPERLQEFHRLFRNDYWQVGGGVSYSIGTFDVFASFAKYVWGTDTHDGQAYTVGATWYFGGTK
jgi:hypothetical protein